MEGTSADGSLQRLLRILYCFTDKQPSWGVRELSRELGLHHTSTHRWLKGLATEGWLQFDPRTQRYSMGAELYRLGLKIASRLDIAVIAHPVMKQLARTTQESVYLCVYMEPRQELVLVAGEESQNPLRYVPEMHRYLPLHIGATGRSIMAFLPDETIDEIIQRYGLVSATANSITDPDHLWQVLRRTRQQGFALSFGERVPESAALGAPIHDAGGRVRGSVVLVMPSFRWDPERESEWAAAVMEAAGEIARTLGYVKGLTP